MAVCACVCVAGMAGAAVTENAVWYQITHGAHPEHDHVNLQATVVFDTYTGDDGKNYLTVQLINSSTTPSSTGYDVLMGVYFGLRDNPNLQPVSATLAVGDERLAELLNMPLLAEDSKLVNADGTTVGTPGMNISDKWLFLYDLQSTSLTNFPNTPWPYYGIVAIAQEGNLKDHVMDFNRNRNHGVKKDLSYGVVNAGTDPAIGLKGPGSSSIKDPLLYGSMIFTFLLPDDYVLDLTTDIYKESGDSSVWFQYSHAVNHDEQHPTLQGDDKGLVIVPDLKTPEPATLSLLALSGLALLRRRK